MSESNQNNEISFYEKVCGLCMHGSFKGDVSPVVCEVFQYASAKLDELKKDESKEDEDSKNNENHEQ